MTVMMLMAGDDSAFRTETHRWPRNLVEIGGQPLVQHVLGRLDSLLGAGERLVCAVRDVEDRQFHTADVIRLLVPSATVRLVPETAGAACTALLAAADLPGDEPLLLLNGDQVIDADLTYAIRAFRDTGLDGGIICFESVHPRWSYVRTDARTGLVIEAAEKRPISNQATAGAYWFARTSDFVDAVSSMIIKDAHVDGRYFVCPAYNEMVLRHARVGTYEVSRENYHSLATPEGVADYAASLVTR